MELRPRFDLYPYYNIAANTRDVLTLDTRDRGPYNTNKNRSGRLETKERLRAMVVKRMRGYGGSKTRLVPSMEERIG